MAIINWLIVARPIEAYRRVEIRRDCMIIDGADVFWMGESPDREQAQDESLDICNSGNARCAA